MPGLSVKLRPAEALAEAKAPAVGTIDAVFRYDPTAMTFSTVATFEPIPNPTPIGPPMIPALPIGVMASGDHLLVACQRGFPYLEGVSTVYAVWPDGAMSVVRDHLDNNAEVIPHALPDRYSVSALSAEIAKARDVLYLGRGAMYPIALEGALKLKEISYIHAEGYAAGEMKHGPIALIDDNVPIIVLAPSGPLFEKTVSNMQEVQARGGKVVLISDAEGIAQAGENTIATIEMPKVHPLIAPLVYAVPVQLLAYHAAVARGTDVDQPRNLAKSVTVE